MAKKSTKKHVKNVKKIHVKKGKLSGAKLLAYRKEKILESIGVGNTFAEVCHQVKMTVMTLWRWRKEDKSFDKSINAMLKARITVVEDALYRNAIKYHNITAQIFWLCNRAKDRWQNLQKVDVSAGRHTTEAITKLIEIFGGGVKGETKK